LKADQINRKCLLFSCTHQSLFSIFSIFVEIVPELRKCCWAVYLLISHTVRLIKSDGCNRETRRYRIGMQWKRPYHD